MKTFKFQSFVLVLIAFVLGFSEFLIVGILDDLSAQFNVPVASVGYLVTVFAIVYAVSTPFITILIGRFNLFWDLMVSMAVFTLGNVLSFLAPNFFMLALSRVVTAMVAGVSISLGLTFAGYVAPMQKRGWLLSWVFSGFSIASVVGVPLGTWISTKFGWQISFLTVIVFSVATMIMIFISLPKDFRQKKSTISGQLALLKNHRIQIGMLLPMFNLAAIYVFYTYLRPIITNQLHFSIPMLTILLSIFGISNIIGNRASGKLSEGPGMKGMPFVYIAQFVFMMLMPFVFNFQWPGAILLTLVIFTMPLINSPIQLFFLQIAERAYPQSIVLASSLNSIFSNFGIALGSATGGIIVSTLSLDGVGPGGAVYAVVSLGLVLWLNHLTKKGLSSDSSYL